MPDSGRNVCSSGWQGAHGSNITLNNDNTGVVTVYENPPLDWPFSNLNSGFTVPGKSGNNPGTRSATLQNTPGKTYGYRTTGCPGDPKEVNPKTIIIT